MKFHWMDRGGMSSPEEINSLAKQLDYYGYYSLLLTYHSLQPDLLLKSALAANNIEKIKFMIAVRTYSISPEYLSMIYGSYNELFKDRLMFNIVSGDIHSEERSLENIPMFSEYLNTPEKRLEYTEQWIDKFINLNNIWGTPEFIMSGHSDKTKLMCSKLNITHLAMLNMYMDDLNNTNRIINNKQMISMSIVVTNTVLEAKNFINNLSDAEKQWTICGTKDYVKDEIKKLYNLGVNEIILSRCQADDNIHLTHELVKEIINNYNFV